MGRIIDCGICGRKMNTYFSGTPMCRHCAGVMCRKCSKGAICIECFNTAPADVQESGMEAKKVTRNIILIFVGSFLVAGFLMIPYEIIDNDLELTWLYYIIGLMGLIGALGICPAVIIREIYLSRWYKKNRRFIPSFEGRPLRRF